MAAVDYRQLSAPAQLEAFNYDDGSAAAASKLAGSFKQFTNDASALGQEVSSAEGAKAGEMAGAMGDPQFKSGFLKYTAYSQAYNNAATRSYAIRAENDAEDTAARLEVQANNDPSHFQATYTAVRDATVAQAPTEVRGLVANIYNKRLGEGTARLIHSQQEEYQKQSRVDVSEGIARSTDRIANWMSSNDPVLHAQAEDEQVSLSLMIDGAKNDGTITETEAASAHIAAQRSITEQTIGYRFKNELNNPYGDPVGFIERLQAANRDKAGMTPAVRPDLADIAAQPGNEDTDPTKWAKRPDGSQKGNGWLGLLRRPDGGVSSEISIGVELNGKEQDIPLLVPTLSRSEVDTLLSLKVDSNFNKNLPTSIKSKAVAFAQQRVADGESPFASPSDSPSSTVRGSVLSPSEETKLVTSLFETLRQKNALDSFDKRKNGRDELERYELGDRTATAQLLSGTLTQKNLLDMVTSQNLKPETARTLLNELEKGDTAKDDQKAVFDVKTDPDFLNMTDQDIASKSGLTWKTKADLIEERNKLSLGWRGTQQAKEGSERIDRALGIVPGTPMQALSDDQKRQRQQALTTWYDQVDGLEPAQRQGQAISSAENVIGRFIRKSKAEDAQGMRSAKARYIQSMQDAHGDPGGYGSKLKEEYDQRVRRYDTNIQAFEAEAARQ